MAEVTVIPTDVKEAGRIQRQLMHEVEVHGFSKSAKFAIKLALEEGFNNAIQHGNGRDPQKTIEIEYDIDDTRLIITITDQGSGFNPSTVPDPTLDENLEKPTGRGIMLMRAYMDEVRFLGRGNRVVMVKRNS